MKWAKDLLTSNKIIVGIDHVAIGVSDMNVSLKFYSGILGLDIIHDGRNDGGDKKSFLGNKDKALVALTEHKDTSLESERNPIGVGHVAFKVNDVAKASNILKEKGVTFIEIKTDEEGRGIAYHFLDPDGTELEIYGDPGKSVPPY